MDGERQTHAIVAGVLVLVAALMAWDHLVGNEGGPDEFPVDPATFVLAMGASMVTTVVVLLVVRRVATEERAVRVALWLTGVAVVSAPFLSWLGVPQVLAGGGLASARRLGGSGHARIGIAVTALCGLVLLFGVLGTAFPPEDAD